MISRRRARRAARADAAQTAKVIEVQEVQIAALKAEVAAGEAVIGGLLAMPVWDNIDPTTGEVSRGPLTSVLE